METGQRWEKCELSSIDSSILLCGVLTARQYFADPEIKDLATKIYERVDWPCTPQLSERKAFRAAPRRFHGRQWQPHLHSQTQAPHCRAKIPRRHRISLRRRRRAPPHLPGVIAAVCPHALPHIAGMDARRLPPMQAEFLATAFSARLGHGSLDSLMPSISGRGISRGLF